jgi:aspartyl-tRNA synthetase
VSQPPTAEEVAASATAFRTHRCGALTLEHEGLTVRLGGWVHRRRNLGGLVFIDLRDRDGLVQLSFNPAWTPAEAMERAAGLTVETVVLVGGRVVRRPEPARDPTLRSREVEVQVTELAVVGPAQPPAIPVSRREGEDLPAEELRLKHRVLDLRRPELQANLLLRHRLLQRARRTLDALGFVEIETPILTTPTPEGARDYLVPSRVHPGEFYALPQSPQLYKQILMAAGFDRYFQIARCFRDEDLRADRQPEFTQIDLEASFVSQDDVLGFVEAVLVDLWAEAGYQVERPFPRLRWYDAMEQYGTDKPDVRYGFTIGDYTAAARTAAADFVRAALATGRLRAIVVPGGAGLSRRELEALTETASGAGAPGLLWARRNEGWHGPAAKALGAEVLSAIAATEGDLVLAVAGPDSITGPALHAVRHALIRLLRPAPLAAHGFCWIVDFPLFEIDPATGQRVFAHHPFTAPHPEDTALLDHAPERCRALHYDAVYNGHELGSGSIRITDPELQARVFRLLGLSEEQQHRRFGFLLNALASGAPPMGGFAVGFDRVVMLLAGAASLREVIAFPKTTAARALFEGAPAPVSPDDLAELHLAQTPCTASGARRDTE